MGDIHHLSDYDPTKHPQQIKDALALGMTKTMAAAELGVCVRTVRNWELRHPEFLEAVNEGCAIADSAVQQAFLNLSTGFKNGDHYFPPNVTAAIFWMKNRMPDAWRDRKEVVQEVKYTDMTEEEINERIANLLADEHNPAA